MHCYRMHPFSYLMNFYSCNFSFYALNLYGTWFFNGETSTCSFIMHLSVVGKTERDVGVAWIKPGAGKLKMIISSAYTCIV